jgi:hypothetical protein
MDVVMDDSTSGDDGWSTRVCLRVTKGTSEVDTVR